MREGLRFASGASGGQCVMTPGTTMMHRWCADNLGMEQQVSCMHYCVTTDLFVQLLYCIHWYFEAYMQ